MNCTKCGNPRQAEDFSVDRSRKTEIRRQCKECCREYDRRYYAENWGKRAEYRFDNRFARRDAALSRYYNKRFPTSESSVARTKSNFSHRRRNHDPN
jgi:hypothetical protein